MANPVTGNGKTPAARAKPVPVVERTPARFTYALAAYTVERREDGWYIARTRPTFVGERMTWSGPFETIETACLSIARHLAVEIADRHTRSVEWHKIKRGDPLYGLKPETRLKSRNGSVV